MAKTLHPLPLVLSPSVEADRRRWLAEVTKQVELTDATELTVALTLPPSTAASAVCVNGSRQMEVTDRAGGADRVDSADGADGGTDSAPTAAGAVCVRGSRQTEVTGGTDTFDRA